MMTSTHITVIGDRSGSMSALKEDMEGGFRQFLADQQAAPGACTLSLVQFDSEGVEEVYAAVPIAEARPWTLIPRGGTPLLDAVGMTLVKLGERLAVMPESERPMRVLVIILTDGHENASHEYSKAQVKAMVEHQQSAYKWEFMYLGANVDAFAEAGSMGIPLAHAAHYQASSRGARVMFSAVSAKAMSYRGGGTIGITPKEREEMEDPK